MTVNERHLLVFYDPENIGFTRIRRMYVVLGERNKEQVEIFSETEGSEILHIHSARKDYLKHLEQGWEQEEPRNMDFMELMQNAKLRS